MDLLNLFIKIGAKDEASDKIEGISQNAIGGLIDAAKKAAVAIGSMFVVKKLIDFGRESFDAYAQFEQLWGGVQKLYGNAGMSLEQYAESVGKTTDEVIDEYRRNERAQADMLAYAQQAWRTAGMDANTYMQNATSMSASLINSLGGDTVRAAELTDIAMRAISDNVNTFGSDMESVTNAFMGFARQNYMMLDNLKLGYAGSRQGMLQLIEDANEWAAANGMAANLSIESFADVVTAIEYIQRKQGIYGTTQREALSTIEGSVNAFKAAWQNLVAEFGKPDADIAARIGDMFTAVFGIGGEGGVARNVINEVKVIATNIVNALKDGLKAGADWLASNGASLVWKGMKALVDGVRNLAKDIRLLTPEALTGAFDNAGEAIAKVMSFLDEITDSVAEWVPALLSALGSVWESIATVVSDNAPVILERIGGVLDGVVQTIIEKGPEIISAAAENFYGLIEDFSNNWPELVDTAAEKIGEFAENAVQWLQDNGPAILAAAMDMFKGIWQAIVNHGPTILHNLATVIGKVIGYVASAAGRMLQAGIEFVKGLLDGSTEQGEKVRQWFKDLPQKLLNALGNVGMLLFNAGKSILTGFWDGLKSVWGGITSWVGGIADTIASIKGPLPYDRKVLVDNGLALMYGLQKGLEEGFERQVEPYIESIARNISGGVSADIAVAGYGNSKAGVVNNYYIDGNLVAADAALASALETVAERVSGRRRMGVA